MPQNLAFQLTLLVLFFNPTLSLASQSTQTTLNAQTAVQTVQITDQKFNPIMGSVPYETTCDRQVVDHMNYRCYNEPRESCSGGGEVCETTNDSVCNSHGCTGVPRRSCHQSSGSCHTVFQNVCRNEAVYRTETYSCTRYHTVQVGQTLAKTFNHSIEVSLSQSLQSALAGTTLSVSVNATENTVTARLTSSFPAAILDYAVMPLSSDQGVTVQNSSEKLVIDLGLSAALAKKIDGVTADSLELGSEAFRFNLQNAAGLDKYLTFGIILTKTPSIWFPTTVYDSRIGTSLFDFVIEGQTLKVLVPYEKLGLSSIGGNKYSLGVSISLNAGKILNPGDFQTELNKSFDLNIAKSRPSF